MFFALCVIVYWSFHSEECRDYDKQETYLIDFIAYLITLELESCNKPCQSPVAKKICQYGTVAKNLENLLEQGQANSIF